MTELVASPAAARPFQAPLVTGGKGTGHQAAADDAFPRTRRPLPWLLAIFVALIYLVPFDSIELNIHLPVDSFPDRFLIIGMVLVWLLVGGDQGTFFNPRRSKLFAGAVCVFLAIALGSVFLDAGRIVNLGELQLSEKRLASLLGFIAIGWFALTALRREDIRGFASYIIGLACITSLGVIYERRTGYNIFFNLAGTILKPIASVAPAPTNINPAFGTDGRVIVVGPTLHGLAVTTILTMAVPFALLRLLEAKTLRDRIVYGVATVLPLVAAISTDRKTAVVVPAAMFIYIAWYKRDLARKYLPIGLILLVPLIHYASPGTLGLVFNRSQATNSSTQHRAGDFASIVPDVLAHPLIGRGYGTLDPDDPYIFRINDDEYLDEIWEVGILGLLAYAGMIIAPVVAARRTIRYGDPVDAQHALAASAACVGYLVVSALFDVMSFPQAPYMLFIVAAMATVACERPPAPPPASPEPRRVRGSHTVPRTRLLASPARRP